MCTYSFGLIQAKDRLYVIRTNKTQNYQKFITQITNPIKVFGHFEFLLIFRPLLPMTDWTVSEFLHKSNTHSFPEKFHERSQHMLTFFLITKDQT